MKKLVTFRFDPDLLEEAKSRARADNRTLTNFIETVLKESFGRPAASLKTRPGASGDTDATVSS